MSILDRWQSDTFDTRRIDPFRLLIREDLNFYKEVPYVPPSTTRVHRWYLVRESSSIEEVECLFEELDVGSYNFVIDPFCGSGAVGLVCASKGFDFLGFDISPTRVIGSRAKIDAKRLKARTFAKDADRAIGAARSLACRAEGAASRMNLSAKEVLPIFQEAALCETGREAAYAALASLYGAAGSVNEGAPWTDLEEQWRMGLESVVDDLSAIRFSNEGRQLVVWGDSSELDWSEVSESVNHEEPVRALMLTSPTYIASVKDADKVQAALDQLGSIALSRLGDNPKMLLYQEPWNPTDLLPGWLHANAVEYFKGLWKVLTRFSKLGSPGSLAVIQCENAFHEGRLIEADLMICMIADQLGYEVEQVRVTHYVNEPGRITTRRGPLRGSFVYLTSTVR